MIDTQDVRGAIIARLRTQLPDIKTYDYVSQNTPYPYIRLESLTGVDRGTKDVDFYFYDVTISVYYKTPETGGEVGMGPVYAILKRVAAALHDQPQALTMDGSYAVTMRCAYENCLQEEAQPVGTYYHGVQRYETLIQSS